MRAASSLVALALIVTTAGAFASDTYDKEATDIALRRAARQVKDNCGLAKDANGKETGPWGPSKVSVLLGHNGHSKEASIAAPFDGTPPGKCAVQAFSNLTFPPWAGADIRIEWDVVIDHVRPGRTTK